MGSAAWESILRREENRSTRGKTLGQTEIKISALAKPRSQSRVLKVGRHELPTGQASSLISITRSNFERGLLDPICTVIVRTEDN